MTFAAGVTLMALPGEEDRLSAILLGLSQATRQQPGCLQHRVHRVAASQALFVYKLYVDRQAWEADLAGEHFHGVRPGYVQTRQ